MAQGEFWVERQNWARWPRVLKVNRVTDSGTETRRYVRKGADWEAKDYATRKIAELQAENAKLRDELDLCLKQVKKCEECEAMFNCEDCEAMLDCDECLRADSSQKERKRLDYENATLRELVEDMAAEMRGLGVDFTRVGWCDYADRMRELGVEV